MRQQSVPRVDRKPMNLFRRLGGHFLDVYAPGGTDHQDGPLRGAIHDDPDVALRCDLCCRRDEDLLHGETLDRHAEDRGRRRLGGVGAVRQLHAARFPAAAGMHLCLDNDLAAEALGDRACLRRRGGDLAGRYRNAVPSQNVPRLILVQIHACSFAIVVPASPRRAARPSASSAIMARSPPVRTNSAAASTLGRMLPVPSSFPASKWSACASVNRGIASWRGVPNPRKTAFTLVRINRTCAPISRPRMAATRSLSATASMPSRPSLGSRKTGGPPPPPAITMCPAAVKSRTICCSTMLAGFGLGASRRPSRTGMPRAMSRACRTGSSTWPTGFDGVRRSGSSARHSVCVISVTTERCTPARASAFCSDCWIM